MKTTAEKIKQILKKHQEHGMRYAVDELVELLKVTEREANKDGLLYGIKWTIDNYPDIIIAEKYGKEPTLGILAEKAIKDSHSEKSGECTCCGGSGSPEDEKVTHCQHCHQPAGGGK